MAVIKYAGIFILAFSTFNCAAFSRLITAHIYSVVNNDGNFLWSRIAMYIYIYIRVIHLSMRETAITSYTEVSVDDHPSLSLKFQCCIYTSSLFFRKLDFISNALTGSPCIQRDGSFINFQTLYTDTHIIALFCKYSFLKNYVQSIDSTRRKIENRRNQTKRWQLY